MLYDQDVSKTDIDFMDATYSKRGGFLFPERRKRGGGRKAPATNISIWYGESLDPRRSNLNMCSLQLRQKRRPARILIALFS